MTWTVRQRALLRAVGVRVWAPVASSPPPTPSTAPTAPTAPTAAASLPPASPSPPPPQQRVHVMRPGPQTHGAPGAAPAPAPVDGLGWTALREAVAGCRACALCETRKQTVFGSGHEQAQWLLVGEAPGEHEDEQGEPFVGPAGQLLERMLAALALTRAADGPSTPAQRVFITNTLKCRPPRNRNPSPQEMAQCAPYLARQVALLQPRLILAMGRFAVSALLGSDEAIGKLRGRVHHYEGVPLIVTYHPSYLLRQPAEKARAWADLCLAADVFEGASA